ncbi:MAG: nicotinamide-nucleotide adenylyltransferase [Candidatus Aenigmarchaeota archaeon]
MNSSLFIGRFQPFHNGHLKVIKDIMEDSESITIVVCGPEKPNEKNPFSFEEREEMLKKVLDNEGIDHEIHEIPDVNDDDEWSGRVKKLGKFDLAYSRNPWTIRCLKKIGIPVKKHKFYERWKNCGREIRERILEKKEWKNLVPEEVYEYVKKINGEERIRKLNKLL